MQTPLVFTQLSHYISHCSSLVYCWIFARLPATQSNIGFECLKCGVLFVCVHEISLNDVLTFDEKDAIVKKILSPIDHNPACILFTKLLTG